MASSSIHSGNNDIIAVLPANELAERVSQSLAGRTAMISLLPLCIEELAMQNIDLELDEYLLKGFCAHLRAEFGATHCLSKLCKNLS